MLWRSNTAWMPMKGPCAEHIWVSGTILGEPVLFGVVYLTVASGPHDGNDKVLQCIIEDVKRWGADREVLLMGDFNGHIPATDGYLDYNGKLLLQCAEQLSLEIVNLRTDCEGCFTWCARTSRSTIDYALVTAKLAARIAQVHIDEEGQFSLGSDHNRIRLLFSKGGFRTGCMSPPPRRGMYLPSKSVERVAKDFESSPQRRESRSYSEFMRALDAVMRTQMVQERPGRRPQNPWWDKEVEVAWKERRQANREHRRFVKGLDTEVCAEKWAVYLDRKHKVQTLIQCKIADYNLRLIQSIRQEGRSAAHKFWTYIRSLDRAAPPPPPLIDAATGQPVGEPCEYIAQHFSRIFGTSDLNTDTTLSKEEAISPNTERPPSQTEPPWALSRFTVERALKRIRAGTATGLDGMPARVLKCLGEDSREQLAEILTAIIEGEPIPKEWHEGKVILIPKRGGDARNIEDYRPITVTSVMYRLFAGVIKAWMSGWAETKGLLTELQNGFRPGRRLDDNLFVVTQCAEIARREGRTLLCCFLDVEKAYDSVPHGPLFACLSDLGLPRLLISTIQRLYSDNVVSVQLGAITTGPIHVNKGLRQGCPLSPLLYILYASRIERALLNSNLGFSMRFSTTSAEENFHLPGLAFADDLVVMAESNQELQSLLDICQTELASLGLRFNTKKSAVVRLTGGSTDAAALTLGGELLATRNDYRYLGVTLCVDAAKYSLHETVIRQTALQAQRILRRRCLWGCNRFQMIRDLWKMVHVPGLTFGNAVVCISPTTREWLERQQREVGRAALGCHYRVANEAIQGDVGWSSFEAREAASKIAYRGRLTLMRRTRWARRVFEYLSATCMRTDWTRRLYQLEKKYGFFAEASPIETAAKWTVEVRMRVREAEETRWREAMEAKSTLECYRKHQDSICGSRLYDNSIGSSLLFEARAGALRTLEYRRKFDATVVSNLCRVCGVASETQEHLVLHCRSLPTSQVEGATLPQALGFQRLDEDGSSDNGGGRYAVAATKRRLTEWWATIRRT